MEYRNSFSIRFSILRKQKGISLSALGDALGVTDEAVRLLEKGRRSPSFEVLCALSDYFDVSLDYLVGRSDNPTKVSFSSSWEECFRERLSEILPNFDRVDLLDGGVDIEFLEAIADNKHYLTFHDACGIADELGVSLDYLVGLSDDPDRN